MAVWIHNNPWHMQGQKWDSDPANDSTWTVSTPLLLSASELPLSSKLHPLSKLLQSSSLVLLSHSPLQNTHIFTPHPISVPLCYACDAHRKENWTDQASRHSNSVSRLLLSSPIHKASPWNPFVLQIFNPNISEITLWAHHNNIRNAHSIPDQKTSSLHLTPYNHPVIFRGKWVCPDGLAGNKIRFVPLHIPVLPRIHDNILLRTIILSNSSQQSLLCTINQ